MAARIDQARSTAKQLALFSDPGVEDEGGEGVGRGKGKTLSKLRDVLALRGLRQPEDVLISVAALDDPDGLIMACLKKTEMICLAIYGHSQAPARVKMPIFQQLYAQGIKALEAMLPYGLGKVTPDVQVSQAVQVVVMPGGGAQGAGSARDVTPKAGRLGPPPLPGDIQRNQGVANGVLRASDGSDRTE